MNHKLINTTSLESLFELIDKTIKNNFNPTLAFIYLSVSYDLEYLVKRLKRYSFLVIGSTTVGEIYADEINGVQVKDKSITCMLVDIKVDSFALKIKNIEDNSYYKTGIKLGEWSKKQFDNVALLTLTAGLAFDNESFINGIQKKVTYLFGAAAGDDNTFKDTYIFSNNKLTKSGALVVAFDQDRVEILNSRGFGWSGIGTKRVVTKSKRNIVYTIDDKPAIDFYKEYLSITEDDMPNMGADYPLEVELPDGQIVYRAAISIDEKDGSLLFYGHINEGSRVRISAPMGEMVIEEVKKSIESALEKRSQYRAELTMIFPCAAHKSLLGTQKIKEIEAAYSATKNSPLIGFYAYGEISSTDDTNAFHNETFVTVQLREKS